MAVVPRDPAYRRLLAAQVVALLGTGLTTVALGLLAHDLAGVDAGAVLGTALAVRMAANVVVAPVASALLDHLPRRAVLVALDAVRAAAALSLPWVDRVWQVYLLILVLQAASAAFTPTFQATIPDLLPDERDYTAALSLSRLAYDMEGLLSPALAAAALLVVGHDALFLGTAAGFAASALLVLSAALPLARSVPRRSRTRGRVTRGVRWYLAVPRLRGLLALHLAVAAAGAMVLVNTVGLVRSDLGAGAPEMAVALGAHGCGSLVAALVLPRLLRDVPDRPVMLAGASVAGAVLIAGSLLTLADWPRLLGSWALLGAGCSLALTPAGRVLRRSVGATDRPALFAADYALSHACWLLTYPLAGWLAVAAGSRWAAGVLGAVALAATLVATRLWPAHDPDELDHVHRGLPAHHPHLVGARPVPGGLRHSHPYRLDPDHPTWPPGPGDHSSDPR